MILLKLHLRNVQMRRFIQMIHVHVEVARSTNSVVDVTNDELSKALTSV